MSQLPIEGVMPELLSGVRDCRQLILKAAPGAGKSTFFPLQLLLENRVSGKIIMLEPRRLAARNIARYLAQQLGENVGQRVGYRVKGENKVSDNTQLEIVTEGIMTRMIQSDPELSGVDLIIFDEFHERSIHADMGLALCLEIQEALRDDLKLIVMSATLDHQALACLMPQARYVESQGRSYPVAFRYAPLKVNERLVDGMAKHIHSLMAIESGSLLAFLPGVAAIGHLQQQLNQLPADVDVCPLYGQLSFEQQQAAIQPAAKGRRKVVLATNIAETSLTIEGIRMVVDSGLERVAKYDLKTGITKLEQVRIAQSSAEQRAGRAGRTEAGICLRLYSEGQLAQQPTVPAAEILHSDLSSLAMELAQWGCLDASELSWLDVPPNSAMAQARSLLLSLGLMDEKHQLTPMGLSAQKLGLEPRTAAMLVQAKQLDHGRPNQWPTTALAVVALLEEPERNVVDFAHSVQRFKAKKHSKQRIVEARIQSLARKLGLAFALHDVDEMQVAPLLALAFPDRVAQSRSKQGGRYLLANGHGAQLRDDDPLAASDYLIAIDLMRSHGDAAMIYLAIDLDITRLLNALPEKFSQQQVVDWDEKRGKLVAEERVQWANLIIESRPMAEPSADKMSEALLNYIRRQGLQCLNWTESASELIARLRCGCEWLPEHDWPALGDEALLANLEQWLSPYLVGVRSVKALSQVNLNEALLAYLGWPLNQEIDQWLPKYYLLPTGSKKKIRYQLGHEPVLSVRMQEVFGEQTSPTVAQGRKTVVLELLSPAQRPLQLTSNLASFWSGAYQEVKKEMKGRYPKHVWPDDPANHVATTKTKRHFNQ
ncbi:ATP-dependent RNA helicase HrpB [Vibrio ichthyoenteri ATCC 700023]|uniref:ATP-dependent RNA helicase HrpB n=1 Tax=Vibrio ichthyoenteri ATCC 700023 TaxID=870968 RepID=F9S5T5_9VIBR|nr:ATP-dependent helicase HrpB [Vibrio ichthyoenteri]EGU35103.1 ATP-dependent RNA helicase HrpB [Vibrio ichthyoenteri ATCC 700023]